MIIGVSKVITIKDFFFTLDKYSLCIMSKILFMMLALLGYFFNENIVHGRDDFIQPVNGNIRK